ncbi:DUF6932 family protein [Streptomyces caelestis]|uniref:DUF6932 family protein n=1 Tax=Streptomyces TaxID=1883 RepID=UPI00131DF138|nr:hypothetical protein [Streptomyces luridiscabiei]
MSTAPEFVAATDCLPPGRYAMEPADVEYSFVTRENFADSSTRAELWAEWNQHLTLLQTVTGNKISRAWISGSFVTAKTDPKDVDSTYFIESTDYDALDLEERGILESLIDMKWCHKRKMRIDPYLIPSVSGMQFWQLEREDLFSPTARECFQSIGLYDEMWGRLKAEENGLTVRRGYVEVLL